MARKRSPVSLRSTADRLHSVALHLMRAMRKPDESAGISRARLSALSVIVFFPGVTPAALAQAEGVTRPTVTSLIQGLEADGLIARKSPGSNEDGRFVRLFPTALGERKLQEARAARLSSIENALADLNAAEREAISRALDALEPRVAAMLK
jgi:DNA-binding MarR family transcriptional regulator